jgi:hypothetical protein
MSNNIRIRTTPNGGDKYLKLKLDQKFDFIEILSLNISEEDAYRQFCSNYGVVVGRVIVNSGFGVPNSKVSIFVPIDDIDKNDPLINGLYPYELVTDKNSDGIRYNVLPKVSETNNDCFTPVGTFPTKREVLDNEVLDYIYCKYYKFTTTTNNAGDFMFFGVPLGTYTVHVDVDLSDIGNISQRPYDFIREGSSPKFFESTSKFKGGTNLDKLPQIKSTNVGVNVQPFWGDMETCEIGVSRVDVDLNFTITPHAIFMGSIFGDQHKNSVNKQCRPRGKLGLMCEQVAGEGTIEMIRKNLDNEIEEFFIEGGRVIDSDGTWAYQIPMNLDYVVTDEFGNLVPTENTSVGIPTRSSVRFKIGMDETGGEGRLRTRAKYLVPNNPQNSNEIDYNFGEKTKDSSFKDLYWNKIYTVSNFIPRYQIVGGEKIGVPARAITAIKNVDACAGDKTPFPYNRVNTKTNPIFFIICLIIKIIGFIIGLINYTIVFFINKIIGLINDIIAVISFGGSTDALEYVACITVKCESDGGDKIYAPGCREEDGLNKTADGKYGRATDPYYCNEITGGAFDCKDPDKLLCGWDDCVSFELAKELGLFEFDFYNDWVNGTLFAYLLKYKKRRRGVEKFCEFDCDDFKGDPNYSGVDGNNNAKPDNLCRNRFLFDTCFTNGCPNNGNDCQKSYKEISEVKDGLVKKYEGELYYASYLHNLSFKYFATDLICLGSVFECDWLGFPFLQPYLIESTYKIPPDTEEMVELPNKFVLGTTGMVDTIEDNAGLFFDVNCIGLHTDARQCLNIRHICEYGVDLDELTETDNPNAPILPDRTLGALDIDQLDESFRTSFLILNKNTTLPNSFTYNTNINSNFNLNNVGVYDFATGVPVNGNDYAQFRNIGDNNNYRQPSHSFFMYFGILPGKTALNKMNQKYFAYCKPISQVDIVIDTTIIPDINGDNQGSITFTIVSGSGTYTYTIVNLTNGSTVGNGTATNLEVIANGLGEGTYVITITDSSEKITTKTVFVAGIGALFCSAQVLSTVNNLGGSNGSINIIANGGKKPYTFTLKDSNGISFGNPSSGTFNGVQLIGGLSVNMTDGYTLTVTDSTQPSPNTCIKTGITINGPTVLLVTSEVKDVSCNNGVNGSVLLNINGGTPPYVATTNGPNNFSKTGTFLAPLKPGTYTTTVTDSYGVSTQCVSIVNSPAAITATSIVSQNNAQFIHTITIGGGTPPYRINYNNQTYPVVAPSYSQSITVTNNSISMIILDDKNCQISYTSQ